MAIRGHVLIALLTEVALAVFASVLLLYHRERFANAATDQSGPSNMLPYPVLFTDHSNGGLWASAFQYTLMYKRSPPMSAKDALMSKRFVSWTASQFRFVGLGVDAFPDLGLTDVTNLINQNGWLSEQTLSFTGSLAFPFPKYVAMASANKITLGCSSLNTSAAACTAIDNGNPVVIKFATSCQMANGSAVWSIHTLSSANNVLPMPPAVAPANCVGYWVVGIISGYDAGKQAFYVLSADVAVPFYMPYAYFNAYACDVYPYASAHVVVVGPAATTPGPPPGTSVAVKVTPGRPTRSRITENGWFGIANIMQEAVVADCPYNDAVVMIYDAATTGLVAACQLLFAAPAGSNSSFTLTVSAFLQAPNVSMTLLLDGTATTLRGDAGTHYNEQTFTFKLAQSITFAYGVYA